MDARRTHVTGRSVLAIIRNHLISRYLDPTLHEHVLWMDADVTQYPPDLVARLWAALPPAARAVSGAGAGEGEGKGAVGGVVAPLVIIEGSDDLEYHKRACRPRKHHQKHTTAEGGDGAGAVQNAGSFKWNGGRRQLHLPQFEREQEREREQEQEQEQEQELDQEQDQDQDQDQELEQEWQEEEVEGGHRRRRQLVEAESPPSAPIEPCAPHTKGQGGHGTWEDLPAWRSTALPVNGLVRTRSHHITSSTTSY
jgi:hypothetical protein